VGKCGEIKINNKIKIKKESAKILLAGSKTKIKPSFWGLTERSK